MAVIKYKDKETGKWVVLTESINTAVGSPEVYVGDTKPEDSSYKVWYDTSHLPTPLAKCKLPSGEWVEIAGGETTGDAVSLQPDMAQNDPTQPDYIKNRLAYDTRETSKYIHNSEATGVSFEITDLGQTYIKISNLVPDKDSFSSVFLNFNRNDPISFDSADILFDTPDINTLGFPFGELIICRQSGDLSININDFSLSFNVPEEGIYIVSNSEKPIPEGTSYEITIGELKTIEDKYLPNCIPRLDDSGKIKREQLPNDLIAGPSGVGSSSVQSDYEQNDSTQFDFIKNKPFYDNRVDIHYSYDENPNPVSFDCPPVGYSFYKISDRVLTKEEMFNCYFTINGRELGQYSESNVVFDMGELLTVQFPNNGYAFCVCRVTGTRSFTYAGYTLSVDIPEVGLYRIYTLGEGMSDISTIDIISKEGLKQIEDKYIPDKYKLGWVEPPIFSAKWSPSVFQSIIWDGDTSSRASFLLMDESSGANGTLRFYKVSDQVLTYQDLEDCCVGIKFPDSDEVEYVGYDDLDDNILYQDDDTICTLYFVSSSKPTTITVNLDSEITVKIPYPGTYFVHMKSGSEIAYLTTMSGRIETTYEDIDLHLLTEDGTHFCYQHVSDEVLKKESMVGAKITLCSEEEGYIQCYQSVVDSQETLDSIFMDFGNGGYGLGDGISYIVFIPKDNWEFVVPDTDTTYTFPKAGTYFLYVEVEDRTAREYVEEFGFDEIVHKIDPKFIDLSGVSVNVTNSPSEGSTTSSVGVPVLPTGRLVSSNNKLTIQNYAEAQVTQNYSKLAYSNVPNEFIISFYNANTATYDSDITIYIATEYNGSVTSSIPIETNLRALCYGYYTIHVRKLIDGTYSAETIQNITDNIDEASSSQLVTVGAVRDKLNSLDISRIDSQPEENSENLVKSGGVYQAIKDSVPIPDMAEQNPDSPNYVKNKLVYDKPVKNNLYDSSLIYPRYLYRTTVCDGLNLELDGKKIDYVRASRSSYTKYPYIEDIKKVSTSNGYLSQSEVYVETFPGWKALFDKNNKIPYPLIVSLDNKEYTSSVTINDITFSDYESGKADFYLIFDYADQTEERLSEILYRTEPHKLSNEYINIDQKLSATSENAISAGAVYSALQANQADLAERNPEASSYVKNQLVYDSPLYKNFYPGHSYDVEHVYTYNRTFALADGSRLNAYYKYIGWPSEDFADLSSVEVEKMIQNVKILVDSKGTWQSETVTFTTASNGSISISGTEQYNIPLIRVIKNLSDSSLVTGYTSSKVPYRGFYVLNWLSEDTTCGVAIEFKTKPHKLHNKYLNIDGAPTKNSLNAVTSGGVHDSLVVYDIPKYKNLYPGETYSEIVDIISAGRKTLADGTVIDAYYKYIGYPATAPATPRILYDIVELQFSQDTNALENEVLKVDTYSDASFIAGTINYNLPLVYALGIGNYIAGTYISYTGFYVLTYTIDGVEYTIDTIKYKTTPHKLPNEYLNIDEKPTRNSSNLITSKGVYDSLVVGNKAPFEPLTPGNSYTDIYYITSGKHYSYGNTSSGNFIYYKYIGYPSEELLNKSAKEILECVQKIAVSKISDFNEDNFKIISSSADFAYIQGINYYKFPLVYMVKRDTNISINGSVVPYVGFYVATWNAQALNAWSEEWYIVDTIIYKDAICKLPNQYLNIDDAITENSENPVSSGTVFTALKDVQNNLQFDDTPTQDSEKLVKSGALYTAFADVQKSLEVDDAPVADSEKLVKSGGVHKAILDIQAKVYTKEEIDGKISGIYHYKGSVDYYSDLMLLETKNVGDAYNIINDSFDNTGKLLARAGDNVVYYEVNVLSADESGNEVIVPIGFWDVLAGIVDLSSYALKTEIPTKLSQLLNDGNYLTETDKDLYVITEENKNEEVPEHATVILDTTITEEAEFVDLSEFMRDVPVTEEDNGKYLRVQEGKWAADILNAITHDPQRLSLYEQAQARKNINAAEVWTISKTVDQVSSINGFDELSIIRKTSPDVQNGLVRVCENIYSLDDLVGVKVNVYLNDGTSSEHIIEKDEINILTDNNTLLWSARDLEFNGVTYQLNCLVIAPEDIEMPIFDDLIQKQIVSGTYLSFIKLSAGNIHMTMDITAEISLPMSSDYLEQFLTKSLLAQPLGLATLTENGQIPLEQLPADIGVQTDWNEFNEKSRAFLKNKPFGDIRYANSIVWDGDVSKCQVSSEVNLLPFVGQDISAVYVKISELETYNQTRPAVLNQDIESLYWSTQSSSEITHIALDSTTITYDAGDDGSTVCARLSVDRGVPIIYFVEHYTSKNFTTDSLITFPSAGIYVLYLKDIGFVTQLHWKTASVKTIDERFLPSTFKLPEITAEDEGKVLKVVDGKACWVSLDS